MLIHQSIKKGGNIGPSIHLLHGKYRTRCPSHGLTLIGISIHWPNSTDTFFEIVLSLYWRRLWLHIRSPADHKRMAKTGDHRWFIGEIINLQDEHKKNIIFYQETDGFGFDFIARKQFMEQKKD